MIPDSKSPPSSAARRALRLSACAVATGTALLASCGARTDLLGDPGSQDASAEDAQGDAFVPPQDSGTPRDASVPDASPRDASVPDASPPDASLPDASPHDASPPVEADAPDDDVVVSCGADSCTGCCGSDGLCHPGGDVAACGTDGHTCAVCDPSSVCAGGACVPPGTPEVLLFGGDRAVSGAPFYNDTWVWDGAAWTQRMVTGPGAREGHAMATRGGSAMLFGGFSANGGSVVPLSDTWEWDGAAWTQRNVPGPPARAYHAMAELDGKVVLFGGFIFGQEFGDTWEWDGSAWTQRIVPGPSARHSASMATLGGRVILSGGYVDNGTVLGDTWAWDGNSWQLLIATEPQEDEHATATLGTSIVLSGWLRPDLTGGVFYNETQTFDGASWRKLLLEGPTIRQAPAMASTASQAVLFGGFDNTLGRTSDETWLWDGVSWTNAQVAGPPGRWMTAMARFYAR